MPAAFLKELNAEQKAAVQCTEGFVRVSAGAGTGKTRCLTYRYAYLISALGIAPRGILCVTFTNKAARELKERVQRLCGDLANPMVATFHGFCAEFLRREVMAAGFPPNFAIYDVEESKSVLRRVFADLKVNGREMNLKQAWEMIDGRKADISYGYDFIAPDSDLLLQKAAAAEAMCDKIFYTYLHELRKVYALDFDDLITLTLIILHDFPAVRERWQNLLEYILVDEFQDIDALQYELVEILAACHGNLFIVGDPDQTIYSFRGAKVEFFQGFPARHPGCSCFYLLHNYRSQAQILDLAYSVISRNPDPDRRRLIAHLQLKPQEIVELNLRALEEKDELYRDLQQAVQKDALLPAGPAEEKAPIPPPRTPLPCLIHLKNARQEGSFIAHEIKTIRAQHPKASIAVLYRSRFVSAAVEKALIAAGVPYQVLSDVPFFARTEIKDALCYLRLILNPDDDLAFRRIINTPRRGFGRRRLERLQQMAEAEGLSLFAALRRHLDDALLRPGAAVQDFVEKIVSLHISGRPGPVDELNRALNTFELEELLKRGGEDERLMNLNTLRDECALFEQAAGERTTIADFLQHVALYTAADTAGRENDVLLMTVHNAKGLDFDYVFIAALNEKIFPSAKSISVQAVEEERRLLYVAVTRAKKQLFMSESSNYRINGGQEACAGSRFLSEMHRSEIAEFGGSGAEVSASSTEAGADHLFARGDVVFSEILGRGEVEEVDAKEGAYKIKFDEMPTARTLSFNAPLRRLGPEKAAAASSSSSSGEAGQGAGAEPGRQPLQAGGAASAAAGTAAEAEADTEEDEAGQDDEPFFIPSFDLEPGPRQ